MTHRKLSFVVVIGLLSTAVVCAQDQQPWIVDAQPSTPQTATAARPSTDLPLSRAALPQLKLEDLTATRDRPLFVLDRRPLPPPPPPAQVINIPTGPPKKRTPVLRGIIVSSLSTIVLLQEAGSSDSIIVNSGDTFGPWKVVAETDHSVSLTEGDEKISLDMFEP